MTPRPIWIARPARAKKTRRTVRPSQGGGIVAATTAAEIPAKIPAKRPSKKTKWRSLGGGFAYAPGPVIYKPWRQWTVRDVAAQAGRWLVRFAVLSLLLTMLWAVL